MQQAVSGIFNDGAGNLRFKVVSIYSLLIAANPAVWAWTLIAFQRHSVLLGTAFLAYSFGLRHAVDADHIAAIDNVTRKLMQEGERPVAVGFFFSLGHSSIVILGSVMIAATATAFKSYFGILQNVGGVVGTFVSALFLLAIAASNIFILATVYQTFRRVGSRIRRNDGPAACTMSATRPCRAALSDRISVSNPRLLRSDMMATP